MYIKIAKEHLSLLSVMISGKCTLIKAFYIVLQAIRSRYVIVLYTYNYIIWLELSLYRINMIKIHKGICFLFLLLIGRSTIVIAVVMCACIQPKLEEKLLDFILGIKEIRNCNHGLNPISRNRSHTNSKASLSRTIVNINAVIGASGFL